MIRLELGGLRVTVLRAGTIRLDGGAMFGVVPRALWQRERAPDERHRIELALNVLLIEDGRRNVLVDTGAGDRWNAKQRDIYGLEPRDPRKLLEPAGLAPEAIDLVVNTHLHFDHAGGNTVLDAAGSAQPAFPRAEYVVQRAEVRTARLDNERTRASYRGEDFEPLAAAGRLREVEGEQRLLPYLTVEPVPGHTPGMQMVLVRGGGQTLAFPADLAPTTSHVPYPWIMAYDLEPLVTLATKQRVFPRALREDWWIVFGHDARQPLGRLEEHEGRLRARPLEVEA